MMKMIADAGISSVESEVTTPTAEREIIGGGMTGVIGKASSVDEAKEKKPEMKNKTYSLPQSDQILQALVESFATNQGVLIAPIFYS